MKLDAKKLAFHASQIWDESLYYELVAFCMCINLKHLRFFFIYLYLSSMFMMVFFLYLHILILFIL